MRDRHVRTEYREDFIFALIRRTGHVRVTHCLNIISSPSPPNVLSTRRSLPCHPSSLQSSPTKTNNFAIPISGFGLDQQITDVHIASFINFLTYSSVQRSHRLPSPRTVVQDNEPDSDANLSQATLSEVVRFLKSRPVRIGICVSKADQCLTRSVIWKCAATGKRATCIAIGNQTKKMPLHPNQKHHNHTTTQPKVLLKCGGDFHVTSVAGDKAVFPATLMVGPTSIDQDLKKIWMQWRALPRLQQGVSKASNFLHILGRSGISSKAAETRYEPNNSAPQQLDVLQVKWNLHIHKYCSLKTRQGYKKCLGGFATVCEFYRNDWPTPHASNLDLSPEEFLGPRLDRLF